MSFYIRANQSHPFWSESTKETDSARLSNLQQAHNNNRHTTTTGTQQQRSDSPPAILLHLACKYMWCINSTFSSICHWGTFFENASLVASMYLILLACQVEGLQAIHVSIVVSLVTRVMSTENYYFPLLIDSTEALRASFCLRSHSYLRQLHWNNSGRELQRFLAN